MEKINVAELIKDCPKGMEFDCLLCNSPIELEGVVGDEATYPIRAVGKDGFHHVFTAYGASYDHDDAKCVIFPKGKTTWEGFQRPFKDGDILHIDCTDKSDTKQREYIFILDKIYNGKIHSYCHYYIHDDFYPRAAYLADDKYPIRFATEEEKAKLFQAIKDNGYRWNEKTKTLEELPKFKVGDRIRNKETLDKFIITSIDEDSYYFGCSNYIWIANQDEYELVPDKFDITTLKPFESRVLVRHNRDNKWCGSFFSHIDEDFHSHCYKFVTTSGKSYPMCIPYEGNENLLGTTDDCDEYFKTWK